LSIETGKCLDIEVLTKVCHGCKAIERESDDVKKVDLLEKHTGKCKRICTVDGTYWDQENLRKK
jgi:hypothetical protein